MNERCKTKKQLEGRRIGGDEEEENVGRCNRAIL
jgi:hypothetical protein